MNAGFLEIEKLTKSYDCYIFHDVDMIPENRCNYYTCFEDPLHLGAYVNKFKYKWAILNKTKVKLRILPFMFFFVGKGKWIFGKTGLIFERELTHF